MRYLMLIAGRAEDYAEADMSGCAAWGAEMARRGVVANVAGLRPPNEAMTLRVRAGEVLVTDGPFAETKDQIGGFAELECADLDEALAVAAAHPAAAVGVVEVRPLWT